MCAHCRETRAIHKVNSFFIEIIPCSFCKPISEEEWEAKMNMLAKRIEEAEKAFQERHAMKKLTG